MQGGEIMALPEITEAISSLGLPIALVGILLLVVYYMGKHIIETADKNMEQVQARCKEREETLMEEIRENRRVNEKAIDTIGQYSSKLDIMQSDIKEIKQDVSMMMRGGSQ